MNDSSSIDSIPESPLNLLNLLSPCEFSGLATNWKYTADAGVPYVSDLYAEKGSMQCLTL